MGVEVVNFTKATGGAPVTQNISHNLGNVPIAVIFIGINKTATGFGTSYIFSFGFYDGTNYHCVTGADDDGGVSSVSGRGQSTTKCIRFVDSGQTIIAEAEITSWDTTKIVVNWTTNDANAYHISCIILSGSLFNAKIVTWTSPTSSGTKAITGVGFQPECLIHISTVDATVQDAVSALVMIGFVSTGEGNAYVTEFRSVDAQNPSVTNNSVYSKSIHLHAAATLDLAGHISMDTDGFTESWGTADGTARHIGTLCLKGFNMKVGTFNKSTGGAPASQAVTGVGFKPDVLLFFQACATAFGSITNHIKNGFGLADVDSEFAIHLNSENSVTPSDVDGLVKTDKCLVVADNHTQTIDAEADLTSLDTDGFTLNWTTNNATAYKIPYLAFAQGTIPITDTVTLVDTQTLINSIVDIFTVNDSITIGVLISLLDALELEDSITAQILIALTDTVTLSELLGRKVTITDTITLAEVFGKLMDIPFSDTLLVKDSIMVTKSVVVTFEEPDVVYTARPKKRYIVLDEDKTLN